MDNNDNALNKAISNSGTFSTVYPYQKTVKDKYKRSDTIRQDLKPAYQFLSTIGLKENDKKTGFVSDGKPEFKEALIENIGEIKYPEPLQLPVARVKRLFESAQIYINREVLSIDAYCDRSQKKICDPSLGYKAVGVCHSQEIDFLVKYEKNRKGYSICVPSDVEIKEQSVAIKLLSTPAVNFNYGAGMDLLATEERAGAELAILHMYQTIFAAAAAKPNVCEYLALIPAGLGEFSHKIIEKELRTAYYTAIFEMALLYPELKVIYNPIKRDDLFKEVYKKYQRLKNIYITNKDIVHVALNLQKEGKKCALHNPSDAHAVYGDNDIGQYWIDGKGGGYVAEEHIGSMSTAPLNSKSIHPEIFSKKKIEALNTRSFAKESIEKLGNAINKAWYNSNPKIEELLTSHDDEKEEKNEEVSTTLSEREFLNFFLKNRINSTNRAKLKLDSHFEIKYNTFNPSRRLTLYITLTRGDTQFRYSVSYSASKKSLEVYEEVFGSKKEPSERRLSEDSLEDDLLIKNSILKMAKLRVIEQTLPEKEFDLNFIKVLMESIETDFKEFKDKAVEKLTECYNKNEVNELSFFIDRYENHTDCLKWLDDIFAKYHNKNVLLKELEEKKKALEREIIDFNESVTLKVNDALSLIHSIKKEIDGYKGNEEAIRLHFIKITIDSFKENQDENKTSEELKSTLDQHAKEVISSISHQTDIKEFSKEAKEVKASMLCVKQMELFKESLKEKIENKSNKSQGMFGSESEYADLIRIYFYIETSFTSLVKKRPFFDIKNKLDNEISKALYECERLNNEVKEGLDCFNYNKFELCTDLSLRLLESHNIIEEYINGVLVDLDKLFKQGINAQLKQARKNYLQFVVVSIIVSIIPIIIVALLILFLNVSILFCIVAAIVTLFVIGVYFVKKLISKERYKQYENSLTLLVDNNSSKRMREEESEQQRFDQQLEQQLLEQQQLEQQQLEEQLEPPKTQGADSLQSKK